MPPPAAGGRAAAAAAPRDGSSPGGGGGAALPAFALRRRRPPPLNAVDPSSTAARRAKWSAVARRQRGGGSSSAKSLDSLVMLERESAAGDGDDEDLPGSYGDGLAADASVDRRPGDGGGSSVTARWFANSGKAHTYDVRFPPFSLSRPPPAGFPPLHMALTLCFNAGCARGQSRRGGQAGAEAPRAAARNRAAGARPAADRPRAVADDVGADAARLRHRAAHQPGPSPVRTRTPRGAGGAQGSGGAGRGATAAAGSERATEQKPCGATGGASRAPRAPAASLCRETTRCCSSPTPAWPETSSTVRRRLQRPQPPQPPRHAASFARRARI